MLQQDDIYDFLMQRITEIVLNEKLNDAEEIKERLHYIAKTAELMHSYIGFREENLERQRQGNRLLRVEEEFSGRDAETIRLMIKLDSK